MAGAGGITGGIVGTLIGVFIGWWVSSTFLAGPASQIAGSISSAGSSIMSHMPQGHGYGDDY